MHPKQGSFPQQTTVPWHKGTNRAKAMERVTCSANYGMGCVTRTASYNKTPYRPGLVYRPTEATRHHITAGGQCSVGDQYSSEGRYPPVSHYGHRQASTKEQYSGVWQCRRQTYPHRNQYEYPVLTEMLKMPGSLNVQNSNGSQLHFDCKQQHSLNSFRKNFSTSHLPKRVARDEASLENPRNKRICQDSDAQLNGFHKDLHKRSSCHRVTSDSIVPGMSSVSGHGDCGSKDCSQSPTQQTITPMLPNPLAGNPSPSHRNDRFDQGHAQKIIVAVVRLACKYSPELKPLFVKQKAKYGVFCIFAPVSLYLLNKAVSEEEKRLMEFYVKYRIMLCKVANAEKCQMCSPPLPSSAKHPTRQEASHSAASSMRKSPITQTVSETHRPLGTVKNNGQVMSSVTTHHQPCTIGRSPNAPQPNRETVHPPPPVQTFRQKAASLMKLPETVNNKQLVLDRSPPSDDIVNCFSLKPPAQKIVTPQVTLPKVKQSKVSPGMALPISVKTECIVIDDSDDEETHEAKENHVSGETFVPSVSHTNHCLSSPVEGSSSTMPSTLASTKNRNSSSKESNGTRSHSSKPGSSCYGGGKSAVVVLKNGPQNRVAQVKEDAMNVPLGGASVQFEGDTSLNFLLSRKDATFATFVIDEDGEMTMTEFGGQCCEELMRGRRPQS